MEDSKSARDHFVRPGAYNRPLAAGHPRTRKITEFHKGDPPIIREMAYGGPEDEEYRKFVVFQGTPENLSKFLSTHKPSDPSWNKKNAPWICVQNPCAKELHGDLGKAFQLWEELKSSQIRITAERVKDIAIQSNVTVGKWMIFRRRSMIDETWEMIAEATVAGRLGCSSKVATVHQSDTGQKSKRVDFHLICVYTDNYADTDEVMRVERELRSLGVNDVLNYKPDIYTHFDIYAKNPYNIKVSMYTTKGPLTK